MPSLIEETLTLIFAQSRIFFYQRPVSMRSSFEGLSQLVEEAFPGELLSGACFIFLNRQKNHIKILQWDCDGFVIWYKRLERGSFIWKWSEQTMLDRRSFLMLLEGITPKRLHQRFSL